MRRVLYILAMLDDEDIEWLVSVGREDQIATGDAIITEAEPLEAIFIVVSGRFSVVVGHRDNVIESLSAGEMLGEVSMIDSRPPTATVVASEPSRVLRIDRSAVQARLKSNVGFAARFYKALAVFLAQRLRKTVATFGYGALHAEDSKPEQGDEIDPSLLDTLSLAGARFNMILERLQG